MSSPLNESKIKSYSKNEASGDYPLPLMKDKWIIPISHDVRTRGNYPSPLKKMNKNNRYSVGVVLNIK